MSTDAEKCSFRSCRVKGAELLVCSAAGCEKKVHMMCYQGLLLGKHEDLAPLPAGMVSCTKKCHEKSTKQAAGGGDGTEGGRKGGWDSDGLGGPDDPKTSVSILLDWWMTEGNYNKFCGKNNQGLKKIQFANQLAEIMTRETKSKRDGKNVLNKIQHIEKTFKEAHNFATSETGAGLQERDVGSFKDAVMKKCPYYDHILEIMSDRASSKPKATSYEGDDASEQSGEESGEIAGDLSDISDNEDKSVTTKRTAATTTTTSSKKSRKSRKKSSPIMDNGALAAFAQASKVSEAKMNELARHHQFLEKLEERKLQLNERREERESQNGQWKDKTDELEYKMKLLEKYKELKDKYGWADAQILALCPEMEPIITAKTT
jgi:hypothetical protein